MQVRAHIIHEECNCSEVSQSFAATRSGRTVAPDFLQFSASAVLNLSSNIACIPTLLAGVKSFRMLSPMCRVSSGATFPALSSAI